MGVLRVEADFLVRGSFLMEGGFCLWQRVWY